MKLKLYILFYLLSILVSCSSQKESKFNTKIVKGVITYESEPLAGSYIQVKDTKRGTIADIDGKFEIEVKKGEFLIVSYIGLQNAEIKIDSKDFYEIILQEYIPPMSRKMKRYVRKNGGVVPEF